MSIKSVNELWKARLIAMVWVIISLVCSIAIGITGIALFKNVQDPEKIFIYMIGKLFNPWIAGIFICSDFISNNVNNFSTIASCVEYLD